MTMIASNNTLGSGCSTLGGLRPSGCGHCGGCDNCNRCSHCGRCKNCGKMVESLYPYTPNWTYPTWPTQNPWTVTYGASGQATAGYVK